MVDIGGRGRTPVGVNIYFHALGLSTIAEGKPYATVKAVVSVFGAPDDSGPTVLEQGAAVERRAAVERGARVRPIFEDRPKGQERLEIERFKGVRIVRGRGIVQPSPNTRLSAR